MREVSRHLFIPRRPLIASMLASNPDNSCFWIANASPDHGGEAGVDFSLGAILNDEALPLAGASQLRLNRHDDGIEIGPLARSRLQRRGDLRPAQADFDPIGRDGYPLDNFADEAFHLDGRRGEPSL
jgi:hypothetical protein